MIKQMEDYKNILEDPKRLEALRELGLLDSAFEEAFDRLTQLASKILNAPVSLVSIVDADRQFFKSFVGLEDYWADKRETPLSHAFCKHVVGTGNPLIVDDAHQDERVKDNLGITELNITSYLGMPLQTSDGTNLGSFCVIDSQAREWTDHEIEILRELAKSVMTEIELRGELKLRKQLEEQLWEANNEIKSKNNRLRRVFTFAGSTIEQIEDLIKRGEDRSDILSHLNDIKCQLENDV